MSKNEKKNQKVEKTRKKTIFLNKKNENLEFGVT